MEKPIAVNRRARFEYHLVETIEAGLVLTGTEVKSLRAGGADLNEAYAHFTHNQLFLEDLYIAPYDQGNRANHQPRRRRKLLLHRSQLTRLRTELERRGYTLVPLRAYFKGGWAKVELALAKGKKLFDKRAAERKKEAERDMSAFRR
ncbi:MAG: SsrA-binding protein SmpB [Deinococcus sp.]|nr:SsrA-binding protein SmpB [Deinococcus sp.]